MSLRWTAIALAIAPLFFVACGNGGSPSGAAASSGSTGAGGGGTGGSTGDGIGGTGSIGDCGPYAPGDAFSVCTATYFGGTPDDHLAAVDLMPGGMVVLGGTFPGYAFPGQKAPLLPGGDGAVTTILGNGLQQVSTVRLGKTVTDLEIDKANNTIAVSGDFGVALLDGSADDKKLLWHADLGGPASRVAAAPGVVAVLAGSTIHVFDGGGAPLGMFSTTASALDDIAVDAAGKTVFVTGYRQDDGGACSQYKSTFVRAFAFDGTKKWTDYDWTHDDVGASGDCADSQGLALAMGLDGKLYYAGKSDGGNTVHQKDPRDLSKMAPNVAFDPFNTPYGLKGASAVGYYARLDPATGALDKGQFVLTRIAGPGEDPASAKANAAVPSAIAADEKGNVYVTGSAAYQIEHHDQKTVGGAAVGAYAAYEAFVLIASPDLSKRLTWTVFTKSGPASATAIAAGHGTGVFAAEQSAADQAKGGLVTVHATSYAPGAAGYFSVFPTP